MKQYKKHVVFLAITLLVSYIYNSFVPYHENEFLQADELAKKLNYPTEFHELVADSGHIITILRIQKQNQGHIIDPYKKPDQLSQNEEKKTQLKPVMFLHGLFTDMNCFFAAKDEEIQPFVLANQGFDVWVVNFRGTSITQKHVKYTAKDKEFWDFDNNDFATDDLDHFMKYVGEFTNQKIDIVTISLGGSITYLSLAQQTYYVEKYIGKAILQCPGYQAWNVWLLDFFRLSKFPQIARFLGFPAYHYNSLFYHLSHFIPHYFKLQMSLTLEGPALYDYERFSIALANFPVATSMKNLEYMAQLNKAGKIQKYDYGKEKNLEIYGKELPDEIKMENIRAGEIHIFYGKHDRLIPTEDNFEVKRISVNGNINLHEFENQGHCSFINSLETEPIDKMVQILTGNQDFKLYESKQQSSQEQNNHELQQQQQHENSSLNSTNI